MLSFLIIHLTAKDPLSNYKYHIPKLCKLLTWPQVGDEVLGYPDPGGTHVLVGPCLCVTFVFQTNSTTKDFAECDFQLMPSI